MEIIFAEEVFNVGMPGVQSGKGGDCGRSWRGAEGRVNTVKRIVDGVTSIMTKKSISSSEMSESCCGEGKFWLGNDMEREAE